MEPIQALVSHNVVPMRAEPDERSEQVSQAILGDRALILDEQAEYARIRMTDGYEGWTPRRRLRLATGEEPFLAPPDSLAARSLSCVTLPIVDLGGKAGERAAYRTKLVFGTRVLSLEETRSLRGTYRRVQVANGERGYVPADALTRMDALPPFDGETACMVGRRFLGTPYLWGGTTPFGFDCSGFVQRCYSFLGVLLPRDAHLQAISPLGAIVPSDKALRTGDLVFFCGDSDPRGFGITHVGMALDKKRFIHASGKEGLVITPFDDLYYARTYRFAWRYRRK